MKNQKGFTLIELLVIPAAILVCLLLGGYVMNIIALSNCDFEKPYTAEVIHGVGVIVPPVGMISGWLDLGN